MDFVSRRCLRDSPCEQRVRVNVTELNRKGTLRISACTPCTSFWRDGKGFAFSVGCFPDKLQTVAFAEGLADNHHHAGYRLQQYGHRHPGQTDHRRRFGDLARQRSGPAHPGGRSAHRFRRNSRGGNLSGGVSRSCAVLGPVIAAVHRRV